MTGARASTAGGTICLCVPPEKTASTAPSCSPASLAFRLRCRRSSPCIRAPTCSPDLRRPCSGKPRCLEPPATTGREGGRLSPEFGYTSPHTLPAPDKYTPPAPRRCGGFSVSSSRRSVSVKAFLRTPATESRNPGAMRSVSQAIPQGVSPRRR